MSKKYNERKAWFLERIGKTVYRNKSSCKCETCKRVYKEGLIIGDEMHATYLLDVEGEPSDKPVTYFDTIKERDEYESNLIQIYYK